MNASPDLIYSLVRDTSCFVVKKKQQGRSGMGKRGAEFTLEPNNIAGKNSWKYSGLANTKTVSLDMVEGGALLTTKSTDAADAKKPNKALKKKTLTKTFTRVAKSIIKNTETNFYRPDLTKAALAKWSLIHRAQLKAKKAKA